MRRTILIALCFVTGMLSCSKSVPLTPKDRAYVFTPEDIEGFNPANYRFKTYKNGLNYVFLVARSQLNGFTGSYGSIFFDSMDDKIKFTTSVNVQSTVDRAKELYRGMTKISAIFGSRSVQNLDPRIYQADELFLLILEERFYMALRKGRLVYLIDIDGMPTSEEQVRNNLIKKLAAALTIS